MVPEMYRMASEWNDRNVAKDLQPQRDNAHTSFNMNPVKVHYSVGEMKNVNSDAM